MNMRNGIPIMQPGQTLKPKGRVWKSKPNPHTRYIEIGMALPESHAYASIVMLYKIEWVQQYIKEGWSVIKEWSTDQNKEEY